MRAHARHPDRAVVELVASAVAAERGVDAVAILAMSRDADAISARRETYRRIIDQTGCSMQGLAKVWGCDHQSVRRALMARAA